MEERTKTNAHEILRAKPKRIANCVSAVLRQLINLRHPTILASFAGNYKKCTRVKIKHISKRTFSQFEGEFGLKLLL